VRFDGERIQWVSSYCSGSSPLPPKNFHFVLSDFVIFVQVIERGGSPVAKNLVQLGSDANMYFGGLVRFGL
jgi:hypothetical protein